MNSSGKCIHCKAAALSSNTLPKSLKSIGQSVMISTTIGRGHDQTLYKFFQCPDCGSVWMAYADSGAGGHGTFHRCLTGDQF